MFFLGKLADKEQLLSSREERSAVYLYGCLPKLFKDGATDQIGQNRWKLFCLYISNVRKKVGPLRSKFFYFFKKSHSYHDLSIEKIRVEIDVLKTNII
jgi:hypothetical protein